MRGNSDSEPRLSVSISIFSAPLLIALTIAFFAEPRGVVLLEVAPLGWLFDLLLIWPIVWFTVSILESGSWVWFDPERGVDLQAALRLSGGFLLIYVCVWLCLVPVMHEVATRFPVLPIDPPSYAQIFRFLFGIVNSVGLLLLRYVLLTWKKID